MFKKPDGRILMFQLTDAISHMDLEKVEQYGARFENGKSLIELFQNMLLFIHDHIWRPCSVEMPKNGIKVLVQVRNKNGELWDVVIAQYLEMYNDWYIDDDFWISEYEGTVEVVAWIPLPDTWDGM